MDKSIVLVGGGLHNSLLALSLLHSHPDLHLLMIEREAQIGGNHTWSFHPNDVPSAAEPWFDPLVVYRWDSYEVRFPRLRRVLPHAYEAISSERLDQEVRRVFDASKNARLLTGQTVSVVESEQVALRSGQTIPADQVIDGRGDDTAETAQKTGYQKFLGLEIELAKPSNLRRPVVMDAQVEQLDGYRFLYVLPLAEKRLLVEDTYFSSRPDLNEKELQNRIEQYNRSMDFSVTQVLRRETGVLRMPYGKSSATDKAGDKLTTGNRGNMIHPATGYSLPLAVQLAQAAAHNPSNLVQCLSDLRAQYEAQWKFARLLNRMLFGMISPSSRWKIYERFYRLPEATIRRFYALQTTGWDRARILLDHPPFAPWLRIPGGGRCSAATRHGDS